MTESPENIYKRAQDFRSQGQLAKAEGLAIQLYNSFPNEPVILNLLATLLLQQGRCKESVELFQRSIQHQPEQPMVWTNLATALAQVGQPREALIYFTRAIGFNPANVGAYANRGCVYWEIGEFILALDDFEEAVRLDPTHASAWANRGNVLRDMNRNAEALLSYDRALHLSPDNSKVYHDRALLLEANRPEAALADYERSILLNPFFADALVDRGNLLHRLGRDDEALQALDAAIQANALQAKYWNNRGVFFIDIHDYIKADADFSRAIDLEPTYAEAYNNRGWVRSLAGQYLQAIEDFLAAIRLDSNQPTYWSNLGAARSDLDQYQQAQAAFSHALLLEPNYAEAYFNRGRTYQHMGYVREAHEDYAVAIKLQPNHSKAHFNKALLYLLEGQYSKGWALYDWRWRTEGLSGPTPPHPAPAWDGQPTKSGLTLWAEQGVGDEVFFAAQWAELQQECSPLILTVDHRLRPLYARSFPQIILSDRDQALPDYAQQPCQCPIGSVARFMRATKSAVTTQRVPYLIPNVHRTAEYHRRLRAAVEESLDKQLLAMRTNDPNCVAPAIRTVGLAWHSVNPVFGQQKGLPLAELAPILDLNGYFGVDLQYGDTRQERDQLLSKFGMSLLHFDDLDCFNDLDGLASLIAACDVVVTISNVTAHLAGALGVETHLMLPRSVGKIWYWYAEEGKSLWYPSIRVYQQHHQGDWSECVAAIRQALCSSFDPDLTDVGMETQLPDRVSRYGEGTEVPE